MRDTRWISVLGPRVRVLMLVGGLTFCSWGCHQHHYYYGTPGATVQGCPPGTTVLPSTVSGPVCDVSTDGTVTGTRSTTVSEGQKSRVVVSSPASGSSSRYGWRPSDPEATPAVTQVDGAYSDSSVKK